MFSFCISILLISGCQVNLIDKTAEVPWYYIIIPIFIIFVVSYLFIIKPIYICPKCRNQIKPRWYDFSIVVHFMGKRLIKCPHCKKISFCKIKNFSADDDKFKKS